MTGSSYWNNASVVVAYARHTVAPREGRDRSVEREYPARAYTLRVGGSGRLAAGLAPPPSIHVPHDSSALKDAVRAQYIAAWVGDHEVEGYRETKDVRPDSTTETYVALKLLIDNWRWAGVPFYPQTGKALKSRRTEVAIEFKQVPFAMLRNTAVDWLAQNFLVINIQPSECIGLQFNAKVPRPIVAVSGVGMTFKYEDYCDAPPSTGYETLIYDCIIGDPMLFQRADEIEAAWRAVQPFLDAWREAGPAGLAVYKAGSEGPPEADQLFARDGRLWRPIA